MLRRIKIEKASVLFLAIIKIEKTSVLFLAIIKIEKASVLFLVIKIIIYEARFEVRQYNFLVSAMSEFF